MPAEVLELVPDRALVKVAAERPVELLRRLADQPAVVALRELPGDAGRGLRELRTHLGEARQLLGRAPDAVLDDLAGGGAAFWFDLVDLRPEFGLALASEDAAAGREALELLLEGAAAQAGHPGAFAAPTAHRDGVDLWALDDGLAIGWRDGLAVAGPSEDAVLRSLGAQGAAARARTRGHWTPVGPADAARARIELARVRLLAELGGDGDFRELLELPDRPEGQLVFGRSLSTFGRADVLDLWLAAGAEALAFGLVAEGPDVVAPSAVTPAVPPSERDLLYACVDRRPGALVDGTLVLGEEDNAELAKNLSQVELLMGGLDLRRDVLPALGPTMQLIAREIDFATGPEPQVRTPALALVVQLADGERLREPLIAAFQNAIVLRNVDRAQKGGGAPFVLRRVALDERRALTTAHYRRPLPDEPVDMLYNVAPSCAAVGDWLVLASHEDLLVDLLDELPQPAEPKAQPVAEPAGGERLVVTGARLVDLLASQRAAVELSLALRRGVPEARAAEIVDGVLTLLEAQSQLALELSPTAAGGASLSVRLDGGGR